MHQTKDNHPSVLYVYVQDDSGRFWVYDGSQYHHFFGDTDHYWYVRSQEYLPAGAVGGCFSLNPRARQTMEAEISRHGIVLPFFESEEACTVFTRLGQQEQYIVDRTYPAGFFYLNQ